MKIGLKHKRKFRFNHSKRNISIFLVFVLFLGIGYSVLGTDLGISGSLTLSKYKEPIIRLVPSNADTTAFRNNLYRNKIKIINKDDEINPNVTTYIAMFNGWKTTQKIYVKDAFSQNFIITNSGNSNLTTSNVLIKT